MDATASPASPGDRTASRQGQLASRPTVGGTGSYAPEAARYGDAGSGHKSRLAGDTEFHRHDHHRRPAPLCDNPRITPIRAAHTRVNSTALKGEPHPPAFPPDIASAISPKTVALRSRSAHQEPTINDQLLSGNEARLVACKEDRGSGDIGWKACTRYGLVGFEKFMQPIEIMVCFVAIETEGLAEDAGDRAAR